MKAIRISVAALAGLLILAGGRLAMGDPWVTAVVAKGTGRESPCPWRQLLAAPWALKRFEALQAEAAASIRLISTDTKFGIAQYSTPTRRFWIPESGRLMNGSRLLAYILAEQVWLGERAPDRMVQSGDVVLDIGAHIGSFGDDALRRGAAKVIMVEPDPVNLECIRRNFTDEISDGRVIIVPEGAWSSESTLDFHVGVGNSGNGSFVVAESESSVLKVPVRPVDQMMTRIGLEQLDFVKIDIEGAEREALAGARATLRRYRPRIMLDAYHLPDDHEVLPEVIRAADERYELFCAACAFGRHKDDRRLIPYSLFFD
jgi:FkbM family methyltransferase